MNCPSDQSLLLACMGELSEKEAQGVFEHLALCSDCSDLAGRQTQIVEQLKGHPELSQSDNEFVAQVMGRCENNQAAAGSPIARKGSLIYAMVALLAAMALWLSRSSDGSRFDVVTARGTAHGNKAPVTTDVLMLRGKVFSPIAGAELHPGDGIAVRVWNASDTPTYLAVFALDALNTVHWIYPAYLNASQNPKSILLKRSVEGQLLEETVEPAQPANGELRVVAVVTPEPLFVRDVEAKVLHNHRPLSELFPKARVQEWSCTWNAP